MSDMLRILDRGYALIWRKGHVEDALRGLDDDFDERILATAHMRARGRGSGVPAEMHLGQIWTHRDGRFTRMVMYPDAESARRAAGLA